jgi:ankyrin repeat protein
MGLNIDSTDSEGGTALHTAAYQGHREVVSYLIRKGASLTLKDNEGSLPIHKAAFQGHEEALSTLIRKGLGGIPLIIN